MYLPKNKFRVKYSNGGEFTLPDGSDFVGSYIETSGGNFIQGSSLQDAKETLTPVANQTDLVELDIPFNDYFGPTQEDYSKGFFTRYIIQERATGIIKEVNKRKFITFRKFDIYEGEELVWFLNQPFEDTVENNYLIEGSRTKNRKTIEELESLIPGLSNFLDPDDYLI